MGTLTSLAPVHDAGRLIITDHPVLVDGRRNIPADLQPGESLYSFLSRHVDLSEQWEVRVGGEVVPVEYWMRIKPKHGQVIEVVHAVNRQALYLVAMIALTYFTFGVGAAAGGWAGVSAAVGGGIGGAIAAGAVYVAGSILINKVLGPKPPEPVSQSRDSVYSITSARNQPRPYDPVALLMGHSYITPDLASMPYVWHEGDDQYLGMVLNVGINVHDVGDIYHGEGLLSQFDGVQVYYNGIPGKPNQTIPLYSNADTIQGGVLEKTTAWVERTTPTETRRIQINIEGQIGDVTSKGKFYHNQETIQAEYRPVGGSTWQPLTSRVISNANDKNYQIQRVTLSRDVAEGQYEVRVRRLYTAQDKDKGDHFRNATSEFQWTTMVAVQADEATYAGMGRIGIRVRATGQLSGALDQLRMEAWSRPIPVWNGTAWVTEATSNPGALILQFLRGIHDENGKIIAGLGLDDDEIDIPSLQAFMVHCAANGYQYNHYLRDVRNNGDQLDAMARAGFGAMSWESGRWGVVWAADGQPVSGVVNMATIKKGQFQVDYTLAQAADGIEYTYLDSADWQVKTLRVPAPGVDVMLNPATVQAEGVSTEAHAAQMARWHLAQSLYQYKDIVFSTDLEHLAYKRMDVLQLQHDLTQWGYGGRLVAVDGDVLTLDEPVPGNSVAWIGIRIPGEPVYRTLRVRNFTGESDTIELLDPWPADAPLPSADNPAHDYIWIYDFKATPGYRVRVVGKELESDAKGASVAVVPESPEFWNYVKTGEYIPPQPGSILDTRPKASNVVVSEVQVVTGDVVHTELAVTFDLKGPAARTVIFAGIQGSEIGPVAETVTQTARFRIGSAGTYTIVVRPYNADGIAGEAATVTYTTEGTDIPPPPFDWVSVEVGQSGLRRYAWGYHQFQPADLAGAEIRFMPGTVADPDWETMTPLGADGFFTAAFESDVPVAGDWTFAFAAINTAGELSAPVVTHVTLTENVGEHLQDHEDRITSTQEIVSEILNDFADMAQQIADVQQEAQQAAAALRDDLDALTAQVNSILGSEEWDEDTDYTAGTPVKHEGGLYVAKQDVPAGTPVTDAAYWQYVGEYNSVADAVAAVVQQSNANATEIDAHATVLAALGAMTPDGTAFLLDLNSVRVAPDETLAQRLSGISAAFGDANARIDAEELARANADAALAQRTEAMEARMPTGDGDLATAQSVTQVSNRVDTVEDTVSTHSGQISTNTAAIAGKADSSTVTALSNTVTQQGNTLTAHGTQLSGLSASVGDNEASINELREVSVSTAAGNLLSNPGFEAGTQGWGANVNGTGSWPAEINHWEHGNAGMPGSTYAATFYGFAELWNARYIELPMRGQQLRVGFWSRHGGGGAPDGRMYLLARCYDANGNQLTFTDVASRIDSNYRASWVQTTSTFTPPAGTAYVRVGLRRAVTGGGNWVVDDVFVEPITNTVADMQAKYSLAVTAGGDVAGMQLLAGGGTSAIRFLANSMDVVDPGGASGWSLVGGIATWRKGSHMVVIGPGFGANNEFMYWSGPIQSNLANCRRNNAIRYETVTGESFQRGGIIAGTRVHSGFNPAVAVPSTYTTPALSTGGNPIAVNASVSYFRHYTTDNNAGRFTPGPGSNTATLQLWRKIGSGAWSMVSSQTFTGTLDISGDPTTSDQALWNINGAITFTDTAGGTQNRQYEARLVTRTLQGVSTQNPAHNIVPLAEQQSVGIVTEEDP